MNDIFAPAKHLVNSLTYFQCYCCLLPKLGYLVERLFHCNACYMLIDKNEFDILCD